MTKHTPGPWTYQVEKVSGPHLTQTPIFAHGDVIGLAYRDVEHDNSQANARLIAAAPELLAACKAQHNAIDTLFARLIEADPTFMPSKSGVCWDACLAGNAAIAKATEE